MGLSGRGAHDRSRIERNLLAIRAMPPFGTTMAMTASPILSLSGTPLPTSSTIPAASMPGT